MDNKQNLIGAIASCAKVKLPNGLVGKLSKVLFMFVIVFGIVIIFSISKSDTLVTIVLASMFIAVLLVLGIALIIFASKHPEAALLEGAEFITHEQIQLASKNNQSISFNPNSQIYESDFDLSEESLKIAEQPDSDN